MTKLEEAKHSIKRLEKGINEIGEDEAISDRNKDLLYARVSMNLEIAISNLFNPKVLELLRRKL